jgi:exosortase
MHPLMQTEVSTTRSHFSASRLVFYQLGIVAVLSLWLYWSTLTRLLSQWWHDPNFSHGFFVPLFSIFVVWQEKSRLAKLIPRPSWTGLVLLCPALFFLVVGQMGAELFVARSSLLLLLGGIVVLFFGWTALRAAIFPWVFLLLMIPIPNLLLNQITFPLQIFASKVAAAVLSVLSVPTFREGNVLNLASMPLEVAEACSGIRSLMSLVTLAVIYGYLTEKRLWVRILLACASVPIAVVANSIRIIGTGLLVQYWDPEMALGYFHASWGWIIFVVSLVLLYSLHSLITTLGPKETSTR